MFIHIDGIDGSGKTTLLQAARSWAEKKGFKIFDVLEWSQREKTLPTLSDIGDADVLLTAEPTHVWIGAAIRDEIIRRDTPYSARFAAEAFALDRGLQYTRLILPFLKSKPGRWVVQDRGLLSSLAYQPLQNLREKDRKGPLVDIAWLLSLEGNRIALENPPEIFVFLDIDPQLAKKRLAKRTEKIDEHVYDKEDFQAALAERFRDPHVTLPLTERGTRLVVIDGSKDIDGVSQDMVRILEAVEI